MTPCASTIAGPGQTTASRRRFLQTGAAALAAASLPGAARLRAAANPNGKVQHACIGVGGMMGLNDVRQIQSHPEAEITALCDIDQRHLAAAAEVAPNARHYRDWREMLDAEGDRIDSVNVTVPDHMHASIAAAAIRAGKHVYCQKPMCHSVAEVRLLTELAKKHRVVSQLGNQHSSGVGDRMGVEYLRSGVIGEVRHAYLCSNRASGMRYRLDDPAPPTTEAPGELDWDLFLGVAPERPFAHGVYHPAMWRTWLDFGTGWSGDIGCHILSAVWKGLDLSAPASVSAKVQQSWIDSPERRAQLWPQANHISWQFDGHPASGGKPFTIEWFDGIEEGFYPPKEIMDQFPGDRFPEEVAVVVGEHGMLVLPHGSGPILLPRDKFADAPRPEVTGENHYHAFINAIREGTPLESDFSVSGPMTETVLLGTVAVRVPGETLQWDAAAMAIPNHEQAHQLLRRDYRDGWQVDGLG